MEYLQQVYCSFFSSNSPVCTIKLSGKGSAPRKIVAFGNVLLDHTIDLRENPNLIDKLPELPEISKAEVNEETLSNLTAEICSKLHCTLNPGGSSLNTVRILKKLGTEAAFFGAVGEDKTADTLREVLQQQGIDARLQTVPGVPTGQCVCLFRPTPVGEAWYANIGASKEFSIDMLKTIEKHEQNTFLSSIEKRQIIYIEGFFLTHQRYKVCEYISQRYIRERRQLAINLSAPYIVQEYYEILLKLAYNAFFIFGNEEEFKTFVTLTNNKNIESFAQMLLLSSKFPKVLVMTKGADGVYVISNYVKEDAPAGDITYQSFNAPRVKDVVDTTGAGDSFVAGFLHAWLEKRQLSECVRMASDVAAKVVTQIGANLPPT